MIQVRIPTPLFSYTNHEALVQAAGTTLEEISRDLDRRYPGIRFRMIDEQNQIRPHVKIFVNRRQVRDLAMSIAASDEIAIVQAFSGG